MRSAWRVTSLLAIRVVLPERPIGPGRLTRDYAIQRMRAVNAAYGTDAEPRRISTFDVLDFANLQRARTNGLGEVTGSLTPGKQADVLVIRAEDVNNMPLNDAVGTLVLGVDARNVDTVFVAGWVRKWDGRLLDVDLAALRDDVTASRDYILNTDTTA